MNGILSNVYLQLGIGIFIAVLIACFPFKMIALCTTPFSMKTFGIRKIKRWHSRTDTLANFMIWISIILCVSAPWIPYSPWIYGVWLTFTYLCTLSRVVRLTQANNDANKRIVIFFVSAIYAISLMCALGMMNGYMLWKYFFDYANMIESKEAFNIMLYLNNITPMGYLAQLIVLLVPVLNLWGQFKYMRLENTFKGVHIVSYVIKTLLMLSMGYLAQLIVLLVPVLNLWGQFKYMRLENTFKGVHIVSYVIKTLLMLSILFGLGAYSTNVLSMIYNQDQTLTKLVRLPHNKNEVDQITSESMPPEEAQPSAPVDPNAPAPVDPNVPAGV